VLRLCQYKDPRTLPSTPLVGGSPVEIRLAGEVDRHIEPQIVGDRIDHRIVSDTLAVFTAPRADSVILVCPRSAAVGNHAHFETLSCETVRLDYKDPRPAPSTPLSGDRDIPPRASIGQRQSLTGILVVDVPLCGRLEIIGSRNVLDYLAGRIRDSPDFLGDDPWKATDEIVDVHLKPFFLRCTPIIQYGIGNANPENEKIFFFRHCKEVFFGTRFASSLPAESPLAGGLDFQTGPFPPRGGFATLPLSRGGMLLSPCRGVLLVPLSGGFFCFPPMVGDRRPRRPVV